MGIKILNINDIEKSKTEILNTCKNATFITRSGCELIFNLVDESKENNIPFKKTSESNITDVTKKCPKCGGKLVERTGKYGKFTACGNYPKCKYIQKDKKDESRGTGELCPQCGSKLIERNGRYGKFIACSSYPKCKYVKKDM